MSSINELVYAECEKCNTLYPELDMNYDDDTGFHTCIECDEDDELCEFCGDTDEEEEEPQQDICCKCGRFWNKGLVCDCGCSHRVCCDTCKD